MEPRIDYYKVKIQNNERLWWNIIMPSLPVNSIIINYSFSLFNEDGTLALNASGTNDDKIADSGKLLSPSISNKNKNASFVFTIVGPVPEDYKLVVDIMQGENRISPVKKYNRATEKYVSVPLIDLSESYTSGADIFVISIDLK